MHALKLEQIFELYGRLMYYIAYQILKDEFRAEDAVQEAFLRIAKKPDCISDPYSRRTKAFLSALIRNVAVDMVRQQVREIPKAEDEWPDLEASPFTSGVELTDALRSLPERYRSLILLRFDVGYSVKEISDILGMKQDTVRRTLYRAKEWLKKLLESED